MDLQEMDVFKPGHSLTLQVYRITSASYVPKGGAGELDKTCDRLSRMLRKLYTSIAPHAERSIKRSERSTLNAER